MGTVRKDGRNKVDQLPRVMYQREQTPKGGGLLHPAFAEWLMGFPIGWTDCDALETPSSLKSP